MNKPNQIIIKGACEHNLKKVDLTIPKGKLVVFTGVSGSGKSSMAFDTIFAEGQRRYVESLSSYARQFLGVMAKPKVEFISGLSPSISIDQKNTSHNPRSTVGTVTEIYDYLRLLFAKIGTPYCPNCRRAISKMSVDEITESAIEIIRQTASAGNRAPQKFEILCPVVREKKGSFSGLFENLASKGFYNVIIDGTYYNLENQINLIKTNSHNIDVIIESMSVNKKNMNDNAFVLSMRSRLFSYIEQSLKLSDGLVSLKHDKKKNYLFSEKMSCPQCNISLPELEPRIFSFNSPIGACQKCRGLGVIKEIDEKLLINDSLSISQGAIIPFARHFFQDTWYSRLLNTVLEDLDIRTDTQVSLIPKQKIRILLDGNNKIYDVWGKNRFGRETVIHEQFTGLINELKNRYTQSQSDYTSAEIEKYMSEEICDLCQGCRLQKQALSVKINQYNIDHYSRLSIDNLQSEMQKISKSLSVYQKKIAEDILQEIIKRLQFLTDVGLTYLTLNRASRSLSGGESQRIRLASQIGSGLTGVTYVLDEPSIGLHSKDVGSLLKSLANLRDLDNTIIVVEHDPETIFAADHIIDFGPLAGNKGGNIVFQGEVKDLLKHEKSITGQYLRAQKKFKLQKSTHTADFKNTSSISIKGCKQYNLKNINANFPIGKLICVTGVSGSGKSTLVVATLYKALKYYVEGHYDSGTGEFDKIENYQYIDKVYLVDQSPIGRTPRSNPATYIGAFDHIREVFAQTSDARYFGYKKGRFSFNVKGGRCEKCMGAGTIKIEMQFLSDVFVQCDVCRGLRYNSETLQVNYKSKNIYDVLNMSISESIEFFRNFSPLLHKLKTLEDVGLGYMQLGQQAPTLSGGEAQRVKLAAELSKKETGRTFYILDEPTTGLHLYDIEKLMNALYRLILKGNTVVLIEHNLDVIRNCHYIIDLGPEGGQKGGEVIFQGKVEEICNIKKSYTGQYLSRYFSK